MKVIRRTTFVIALVIVSVSVMLSGRQTPGIKIDRSSLASHGYDAVAYVTRNTAIKGRAGVLSR